MYARPELINMSVNTVANPSPSFFQIVNFNFHSPLNPQISKSCRNSENDSSQLKNCCMPQPRSPRDGSAIPMPVASRVRKLVRVKNFLFVQTAEHYSSVATSFWPTARRQTSQPPPFRTPSPYSIHASIASRVCGRRESLRAPCLAMFPAGARKIPQ